MTLPEFDIHAPFDAPIRVREAREKAEREKPLSDKQRDELADLVREAYRKVTQGKKGDDHGT